MTPEEKAVQLVKQFGRATGTYINDLVLGIAKGSALICCYEIIEVLQLEGRSSDVFEDYPENSIEYWQLVRLSIEKL